MRFYISSLLITLPKISSVQSSRSVVSSSLRPHELQHARPPCPSPTPGVHPNPCPSSRWCHLTISSSVIPFSSCLQSFPTSGSFQMSQLFALGGQNIGASASAAILPIHIQGWFPVELTDLISLQSKGLSKASVYLVLSLLYGPTLTILYDYWKDHCYDYMNLCQQRDISAF